MKTVITCNMGNYDDIKPPRIIPNDWEFILFSDRFIDVPPWQCTVTKKHNREIKIKAEDLFPNYTLYVDGSIEIIGDLNEFIKEVPAKLAAWKHPHRDTVVQECDAVIRLKGCDEAKVWRQMERYGDYEDDYLAACGVLLRDLSDIEIRRMSSYWYNEYLAGPGRDQLSFPLACKKFGLKPVLFDDDIFNRYFSWHSHIKQ